MLDDDPQLSSQVGGTGGGGGDSHNYYYRYTYAVYRAGKFHRYENGMDGQDILDDDEYHHHDHSIVEQRQEQQQQFQQDQRLLVHQLPLRLLHHSELYTINDLLGITSGPPDIDHIKVRGGNNASAYSSIGSLARKNSASSSAASLYGGVGAGGGMGGGSSGRIGSMSSGMNDATATGGGGGGGVGGGTNKKRVGFAPQTSSPSAANSRHRYDISSQPSLPKQPAVTLTSSDGLIVVSAFLPVHVTRSDHGEWSADWDYEALLSMQTHLRVTRVGTVKWRGWHGNVGGGASAHEGGVPVEERQKVEAALRPFNCVPVWVPTTLFGEM